MEKRPCQACKLLACFAVLTLAFVLIVIAVYNFEYRDVTGKIEITDYFDSAKSVIIPGTINNKQVVSIGECSFAGNQLISVTIPDGVITIGPKAFSHNRLTGVTIPDSVTTIGDRAFRGNQLTRVTIGEGVDLGRRVFDDSSYFDAEYEAHSKSAGTYTRPDVSSRWSKE